MMIGMMLAPGNLVTRFAMALSKWSMADVFVVGVFIAFLATKAIGSGEGSDLLSFDAELGPGFYYFLGFCLLSVLSSALFSDRK